MKKSAKSSSRQQCRPRSVPAREPRLEELVDELGAIEARLNKIAPLVFRQKEIREALRAHAEGAPSDLKLVVQGAVYVAVLGEKPFERKITSMKAVFETVGREDFIGACTFPLKELDRLVHESRQSALIEKNRTGTRPIEVAPLPVKAGRQAMA